MPKIPNRQKPNQRKEIPYLEYDGVFPFGKHKGRHVFILINEQPEYIIWAADNEVFEFSEEVLHEVGYF